MSDANSERRLAENEVVFRSFNEQMQQGISKANESAKEDGFSELTFDTNTVLHFYCECSDENCKTRIKLSLQDYKNIHAARNRFVIACGHEVKLVEDVTTTEKDYCVVTKHKQPPSSVGSLKPTSVNNQTK